MLGNCDEKMVLISPTTNEWPQNHHHQMASTGGATATARVMGKPPTSQEQQQQQIQIQQALKCPRCDSSNTKFCYYNNYSLSQPRHFCKACKRYWTRGGTLRNVPVGGGCRKNKRIIKKPPPSNNSAAAAAAVAVASNIDTTTSSNPNGGCPQIINMSPNMGSMFYGLPSNNHHSDLNLPFRFNSSVSNGYDLGLGFSSSNDDFYRNGGLNLNKQIVQDIAITSNSLLSNYGSSMFGSNNSTSSSMASLLASTIHQQKFFNGGGGSRETTLFPYGENMQQEVVKVEEQGQNRYGGWSVQGNQIEAQIGSSGDPNSVYWNTSSNTNNNVIGAAWPDLANLGSSVTSLI